ncbi:MAG: ATP-binding protein [Spirochaetales bacterium]|nr:ATP-binding protein [Spirochaetales bacterium]
MTEIYYKNSTEHFHDELLLIDLMIHAQVMKHGAQKQGNNKMPGLYITGEEVAALLIKDPGYSKWVNTRPRVSPEYEKQMQLIANLNEQIKNRLAASREKKVFLKLDEIVRVYKLTPLELKILLLCLAPEFDTKYRTLYAFLQDDVTKKSPSVEIILDLLCLSFGEKAEGRRFFTAQSPLFINRLIEFLPLFNEPPQPLIARQLKANERIVNYLLDDDRVDDELFKVAAFYPAGMELDELALPEEILKRFSDFIDYYQRKGGQDFILALFGPYGPHSTDVAAAICRKIGIPLLEADVLAMYQLDISFERAVDLLLRESRIHSSALYLKNSEFLFKDDFPQTHLKRYLTSQLDKESLLTFISSRELLPLYGEFSRQKLIAIQLPLPEYEARRALWESCTNSHNLDSAVDIKEIAGKYNLTPSQIRDVVITAGTYALWRSPEKALIGLGDIEEAIHIHSNQKLGKLAQRIQPKHKWNDIILKPDIEIHLRELVKMFRHKHIVYSEWGFGKKLSLGKGISALFYGEPGTGKTLAAEIIAAELGLDLYKIDISSIVSKYIGETEKNLSLIFDEAESSNAILFFDEADSIFGKRTEVKDSHDRYSNIEVSYLLQRIDEYNGVVIMATNLLKNMDTAFERRLHFSIQFPMPDEKSRLQIWQGIFPASAPLGKVDFSLLAKKLEISGGHIKNIALQAAFYAADLPGKPQVTMDLLTKACQAEYKKMGRLWHETMLSK